MNEPIDFSLIWKFVRTGLSPGEDKQLQQWLHADPEHQKYFDRMVRVLQQNHHSDLITDPKAAFTKLGIDKKTRRLPVRKYAAVAAVLIAVGTTLSLWIADISKKEIVDLDVISFDPGIKKATLVLNSGEELELLPEADTLIREEEIEIDNRASKLDYCKANSKAGKKIKYNTLLVPRGAEYELLLSDGTAVKVNSESMLRYPVVFGKGNREVELIGEAYFDVKSDSLHPFLVHTDKIDVAVHGTSFNVSSYPDAKEVLTTLVEGAVKLHTGTDRQPETDLSPGDQGIYSRVNSTMEKKQVDVREFTSWKDGHFYFRNMPLEKIAKVLGRWYDVEFVFQNPNIRQIPFSGNLKRYENIQDILKKLSKTNEITITAYEKNIYLN